MKIILEKKRMPQEGDVRIKTFFAFLPIEIGYELRWFEKVKVRQVYTLTFHSFEDGYSEEWLNHEFIDD